MAFISQFVDDDPVLRETIGERLQEYDPVEPVDTGVSHELLQGAVGDDVLLDQLLDSTRSLKIDDQRVYNRYTTELQENVLNYRQQFECDFLDENSVPIALVGFTLVMRDPQYQNTLLDLFEQKVAVHSILLHDILPLVRLAPYDQIIDPGVKLLLNVILGISSNYSSHPHSQLHCSYFVSLARDSLIQVVCQCPTNAYIVVAIHLLSCYEMGNGEFLQSYLLNSMSCSLTQHMGLHISYDDQEDIEGLYAPRQTPFNAACLWSICSQDRLISNAINVPAVIHFKRIIAPFYKISTAPQDPFHFQELVFSCCCRLWYIYDRFADQILSTNFDVGETNNRLTVMNTATKTFEEFKATIPVQLRLESPTELDMSKPNDLLLLLFHFNYYMVNIQLSKIFIRESTSEMRGSLIQLAAKCGELIHVLVEQKYRLDSDLLPYYLPHLLSVVSLVFLFIITTIPSTSSNNWQFQGYYTDSKELLRILSINWKLAMSALENLEQLESRHGLLPPVVARTEVQDSFANWFEEFPDFQEMTQQYKQDAV